MLWGRARFAFFALACAFVAACVTIASAPQSVFPNIALARVEIFVDAGELPSEDVRATIAAPLESALATLPGLRATRAYADPGKLEIELDFDPATRAQDDLDAARAVLAAFRNRLPGDVTSLVEGPEAEPVVTYALSSPSLRQSMLERRIRGALVATFAGTPSLGRLTVFGGPRSTYDVALDSKRLAAHGVNARGVADAIAAAAAPHVAGTLVRGRERLTVRSGAVVRDATSLAAIAVPATRGRATVPLAAIGGVRVADADTGRQASFDAAHAVLLSAYAAPNGDAVALARSVDARLPRLRAALPPDTRISVAWDQTRLILASQRALRLEMWLGAAIALAVIAGFLRDRALTVTAAIVLPVSLAFTAAVLVRAGQRLDLMTIGGLAIAIGLVVDETIVVVEAIARALDANPSGARGAAIAGAVRRIAKPLVASTAANLVVFLPLAFLGGVSGFFFRALAITLATALVVSIVLSLVIAPPLASALGAHAARRPRATRSPRSERIYGGALRRMLRRPRLTCAIAGVVALTAVVLLARTPTDFLPSVDEGQFEIKYALPPGTSLAAADALAHDFERSILLDPAVAHVARLSGVDTNGYLATPPDAGTLRVTVRADARDRFETIADRVRNEIRNYDPDAAVEVHQLLEDQINDLSGAPEPIQVTVAGPVQSRLAAIASNVADRISDVRGVVDVFDGVTWEPRTVYASPADGDDAAPAAFADALRARVGGIDAADVPSADGPLPAVVRVTGGPPLGPRVRLSAPVLSSTVEEDDGVRVVRVTGGIEHADLSTTIAAIERAIVPDRRALPPGYSIEVGGAVAEQRAAFAQFATVFAIALLLVFGVLLAAFDSFRLPLVVLAAVPMTPIGVALALAATRTPLNVASFMGMLLLVGVVVRNGILLVDGAVRRVADGASPRDAMERAAMERLRPIAMTTFATLGALVPLAAGLGAGSEMERPLAIAVIGGIVTSTALTLAIVPVLFVATAPRRRPAGGLWDTSTKIGSAAGM